MISSSHRDGFLLLDNVNFQLLEEAEISTLVTISIKMEITNIGEGTWTKFASGQLSEPQPNWQFTDRELFLMILSALPLTTDLTMEQEASCTMQPKMPSMVLSKG
jgi:hypothetical protein